MTTFASLFARRDTIYAPATAPGRSAVAIVRISGPDTDAVLGQLLHGELPQFRFASLQQLRDPVSGETLDQALVLRFSDGASFTGELSAELQVHGSPSVVRRLSRTLDSLGVRIADAGEFSLRAFRAGRMDAAQAEALGALIDAETDNARRSALHALDGAVGRQAAAWRARILEVRSLIEVGIDFVDEEIGDDVVERALTAIEILRSELAADLAEAGRLALDVDVLRIAIVGPPNAGKSSLLNALVGRDAAIVADAPGTTRDPVSVRGRLTDADLELVDTAGLRDTPDQIELEGVRRAEKAARQAHRRIFVFSSDTWSGETPWLELWEPGDLVLWNKRDLAGPNVDLGPDIEPVAVATVDGSALREVEEAIAKWSEAFVGGASLISSAPRRRRLMESAVQHLQSAQDAACAGRMELAAEKLKSGAADLQELADPVDVEEVLGEIFGRFCIGK